MKKGIIIVVEIIAVLAVLVFIDTLLENHFPAIGNHKALSYVLYCIAGMTGASIYRLNTKDK